MSKKPYPSQVQDRYIVRFPDGMRDQIAEAALANNRSMNAEIVARLERSFEIESEGGVLSKEVAEEIKAQQTAFQAILEEYGRHLKIITAGTGAKPKKKGGE